MRLTCCNDFTDGAQSGTRTEPIVERLPKHGRSVGLLRKRLKQRSSVAIGRGLHFGQLNSRRATLCSTAHDVDADVEAASHIRAMLTGTHESHDRKRLLWLQMTFALGFHDGVSPIKPAQRRGVLMPD